MRGVATLGARSGVRGRRDRGTAPRQAPVRPRGPRLDDAALRTHRPFLSYNELGSLLDEGPSKLYDALSSILGLEDLVEAQRALQEARRSREKAMKDATDARAVLLERLREVDDSRARQVVAALEGKEWDLDAVEEVLGGAASAGAGPAEVDILRGIASLEPPEPARVASAVAEMREAAAALQSALGTAAARSRDAAALLDLALRYHAAHGDGDCPVCGNDRRAGPSLERATARRRGGASRGGARSGRGPRAGRRRTAPVGRAGDPQGRRAHASRGRGPGPRVSSSRRWASGSRRHRSPTSAQLADHLESASGPLGRRSSACATRRVRSSGAGRTPGDPWPSRSRPGWRRRPRGRARSRRAEAPQAGGDLAQEGRGRDPRRPLRSHRREGGRDLGAPPPAEPRGAGADPAHRRGHPAPRDARRHRRRSRGRGAGSHEPGRAALAGPEPLRAAGHAPREPVPLHRDRRPGAVDGPGPGRRPGPRPREGAPRTGRSSSSPTTTGFPRPCAGSTSPPRSSR